MTLNEKIKYFLSYLKKSNFLTINGTCCCFNDNLTFETLKDDVPTEISIDDDQQDDNFKTFFTKYISDIEIKNNSFIVYYKNDVFYIKCLKFQDLQDFC